MSNGYEAVADEFIAVRSSSGLGLVQEWAASFPQGSSIVDIGAGHGEPLTLALMEAGMSVSAIDASPTLVAAFQRRFPNVDVACEPAENSLFFERVFDGALSVGLIFLLSEESQRDLIHRIAKALKPGGRVLFSAPRERGTWDDMLTHEQSVSLGVEAYCRICSEAGLDVIGQHVDEGGSNYYEARKRQG